MFPSFYLIVCILCVLIFWIIGNVKVEAGICTDPYGACGPKGECALRCALHHHDGDGACDLGLCTCTYTCGPPKPTSRKLKKLF